LNSNDENYSFKNHTPLILLGKLLIL